MHVIGIREKRLIKTKSSNRFKKEDFLGSEMFQEKKDCWRLGVSKLSYSLNITEFSLFLRQLKYISRRINLLTNKRKEKKKKL